MTQMTLFDYEMAQANQAKYVRRITYEETKPFLLGIHYARRMPCITDAFGLFLDGRIAGCVTYGVPASRSLCVGLAGAENADRVLELNRLVISPEFSGGGSNRNLASYLVSHSLKMLPNGTFVVSYADTAWTHVGYVYQACNFLYTGLSAGHIDVHHADGRHSRHYDKQAQNVFEQRSRKHRYVYLVGDRRTRKKMREQLRYPVLDHYPKGDERRYDTDNPQKAETTKIIAVTKRRFGEKGADDEGDAKG